MFRKSLKMFKIDRNISELRQIVKQIYISNISAFYIHVTGHRNRFIFN